MTTMTKRKSNHSIAKTPDEQKSADEELPIRTVTHSL